MERRQVGGGVLAGLAAAVPLIVDMSGFVLPAHAGYALLGLCFAAFVWGMWAICAPNRLWPLGPRRAKPKIISEPALKGGFTLRPDTPLAEAIRYAATGNWDGELGDLTPDGYLAALIRRLRTSPSWPPAEAFGYSIGATRTRRTKSLIRRRGSPTE
jgi:hypothetical protein